MHATTQTHEHTCCAYTYTATDEAVDRAAFVAVSAAGILVVSSAWHDCIIARVSSTKRAKVDLAVQTNTAEVRTTCVYIVVPQITFVKLSF